MTHLLYHFTHVDNLESILLSGGIHADNLVQAAAGCREVGDQDLKRKRRETPVPVGPGGSVSDYVPFYFAPKSPMLFRIATKRVEYQGGEGPLVFIVSAVESIDAAKVPFVFTDGHPVSALTEFFDDLSHLHRVDWPLMERTMWNATAEDPDRQRRRQAEFLVREEVPLSAIAGLATKTPELAAIVSGVLTNVGIAMRVAVRPGWYYQR